MVILMLVLLIVNYVALNVIHAKTIKIIVSNVPLEAIDNYLVANACLDFLKQEKKHVNHVLDFARTAQLVLIYVLNVRMDQIEMDQLVLVLKDIMKTTKIFVLNVIFIA